ncbi:hypothetical protein CR512_10165 [Pseudomonas putida]|nr:hypothetical protein CR512_10165 [Pseudomonas putida]
MTSTPPLHHAQITRTLPLWSKALHPGHAERVVQRVRKDYLAADGTPYSWYASAEPEQRLQLRLLVETRDTCLAQLRQALPGFKGIIEFCRPLLTDRLGLNMAVDQAQYVFQPFEPIINPWVGVPDPQYPLVPEQPVDVLATRPVSAPQPRSLLEAALHNFEGLTEVGAYSRLTRAAGDDSPLQGLNMASFVEQCRALDLGQQYQGHLQATHEGANRLEVERLSIQASRECLRVQAQVAWLKGLLSERGRTALMQLCSNVTAPAYGEHNLQCWRFSLFGIPLHEILLIGPDAPNQSNPCILYIPDDSEHPVREFASIMAVGQHLRHRLQRSEFRRALLQFAYKDRQVELSAKLEHALFEVDASGNRTLRSNPLLHVTPSPLGNAPWPTLYRAHLARMKADAKTIAVPTAEVDAKARNARLQHWFEMGMNVLNVAAFFVPGLNTAMLGVFAYDLMSSVFTGFEAWEEGDTAQALQQVQSLAINAAVIAGFAAGAKVIQASGFVDALKAVWQEDRELLWHPDMAPYASNVALAEGAKPDALGLHQHQGKAYMALEGNLYEVFQDPEQHWRVRHPDSPQAYAPHVRPIGDGRWQLAHEHAHEWDDIQLLRRLGHRSQGLDDAQLLTALRSTGTDTASLRRAHAAGLRPPALLADTLLRLQLDNEVGTLIEHVRHGLPLAAHKNYALPELLNLPKWPQDHVLKVFEGPEPWGKAVRYGPPAVPGQTEIEITRADLDSGALSQTVLAQMDEPTVQLMLGDTPHAQRASVLNDTLAEHLTNRRKAIFDSLQQGHREPQRPAAQALARQFPGLPDSALDEILDHANSTERQRLAAGRLPLRIGEEARLLQARARLDRAVIGLFRHSLANTDTERLQQALQAEHPEATAAELLEIALADRQHCAVLLGQQPIKPGFRSPLRLASGRLGYPLSGRGQTGAAARRLRALYPELDNAQISALQTELEEVSDLGTAINRLEAEQRTLDRDLGRWIDTAQDLEDRRSRQQCAERLMSACRREGGEQRNLLWLERIHLRELPTITATMPHIHELRLDGLQLERLEGAFLANFPHLHALDVNRNPNMNVEALFEALRAAPRLRDLNLTGNALRALTPAGRQAIGAMPGLRILNLRSNFLELDDASLQFLTRLRLGALGLGDNHITLDERLAARFQDMVHPIVLHLDSNPLQVAPDLRFMARLSHLNLHRCDLQQWPEGLTILMSQPQYRLRHLNLSYNRIRNVPDLPGVLRTPFARDVSARLPERHWLFNYNDLEAETRTRLSDSGVNVFERAGAMAEWQALWRNPASDAEEKLWRDLFEPGENNALQGVLERLSQSAEAQRDAQSLRNRVWALLEKAAGDSALRERLNTVAQDFPPTCGDAGADAFSALEIEVLAYEAAGGAGTRPGELLALYRKLYRRDQVNQMADRISVQRLMRKRALQNGVLDEALPPHDELDDPAAYPDVELIGGAVDDIELRLALRQSLAEPLGFPEPSHGMRYRATANVNQVIIDRVEAAVLALDADPDARLQWLLEQPGWVSYLEREYAAQFTLLTDFWRQGHDYLFYCVNETHEAVTRLDRSVIRALIDVLPASPVDEQGNLHRVPLNEGQFNNAMDALTVEQQAVQAGLLASLTRQAQTLGG